MITTIIACAICILTGYAIGYAHGSSKIPPSNIVSGSAAPASRTAPGGPQQRT